MNLTMRGTAGGHNISALIVCGTTSTPELGPSSSHSVLGVIPECFSSTLFILLQQMSGSSWKLGKRISKTSIFFSFLANTSFYLIHKNQWQASWHSDCKLSLIFEFNEESTEIIDNGKDESKWRFERVSIVLKLKYLNQILSN